MGYTSRNHWRPFERASKASHHHIINDSEVQSVIERIYKTPQNDEFSLADLIEDFAPPENNPVEAILDYFSQQ